MIATGVMTRTGRGSGEKMSLQAEMRRAYPVTYALMDTGDIVLFNTKVMHFGGANNSGKTRTLLSFSFQKSGTVLADGFTYHAHSSVKNAKLMLRDFPPISASNHR